MLNYDTVTAWRVILQTPQYYAFVLLVLHAGVYQPLPGLDQDSSPQAQDAVQLHALFVLILGSSLDNWASFMPCVDNWPTGTE